MLIAIKALFTQWQKTLPPSGHFSEITGRTPHPLPLKSVTAKECLSSPLYGFFVSCETMLDALKKKIFLTITKSSGFYWILAGLGFGQKNTLQ